MTTKTVEPTRRKKIMRCFIEHGPQPFRDIRKHVPGTRAHDLRQLCKAGYIEPVGQVPSGYVHGFKFIMAYSITPKGVAYEALGTHRKPESERSKPKAKPKAAPKRVDIVITKASKAAVKLKPVGDVEIVYTDKTRFTTYESKFTYQTYRQPENFMECIR